AGRHPRHERDGLPRRAPVPDPLTRYPALGFARSWSAALAAAVVLIPGQPAVGAIAIAATVPLLALSMLVRPALMTVALAAALLAVGRAELPAVDPQIPLRAAALAGGTVAITGRVADDSRQAGGGAEVLVEPSRLLVNGTAVAGVGNLMVRWRGPTTAGFGDQVRAAGRLTLPRDMPGFGRRAYLAQRDVFLELQASSFDVTASATGIGALPAWLRSGFTSTVAAALPRPHSAVLLGIVLGIRQGIPTDLQKALIATGLIHLLVLSGLKVAVFARIVQGALKPFLRGYAMWPALCLIGLYAIVGGATPAAVRAALMGGPAIAATGIGRPSHVWTSLATAGAAMLAWHPELAWDVGFQLSFAGTAAIILLTPWIERRLHRLPHFFREPFAVTCAAQVGTLPMMAADFHVLSPVGPIANALVLPILPVIVAAGLALGPLSLIPDLACLAAIPVAGLLFFTEQVAYLLAKVPAAAIPVVRFPPWAGMAYYVSVGAVLVAGHIDRRRRIVALGAAALAPTVIAGAALAMWAGSPPQASVLAVGNGQAVLFRGPSGAILVDAGPSPARLKDELGQILPPWPAKLDLFAMTAPG